MTQTDTAAPAVSPAPVYFVAHGAALAGPFATEAAANAAAAQLATSAPQIYQATRLTAVAPPKSPALASGLATEHR